MNQFFKPMFLFFLAHLLFASHHSLAFQCGNYTPEDRRVVKPASCDDTGGYGLLTSEIMNRPELKKVFGDKTEEEVSKNTELKNLALEAKFRLTSNMNGARFKFPSGVERVVFRGSYQAPMFSETSVLSRSKQEKDLKQSCMKELYKEYQLSKIVNYDEIDWKSAEHLTAEEKALLLEVNPKSTYWEFTPNQGGRTFQYKFSKVSKKQVMDDIAFIINEIEGSPKDQGAAYIHCYGGHHRTGAVWGVLQKCIGKMDVEKIVEEYKCHIGWESEMKPGGYAKDNEAVIREFPCEEYFGSKR